MVKKCCVYGCTTNYTSEKGCSDEKKLSVYRFPSDLAERAAWIAAIPNDKFTATKDTVVCELHWPRGFETVKKNGKIRPRFPPSEWGSIPKSQLPTAAAPPRTTKRTSSSLRNTEPDQLQCFRSADSVTFSDLESTLVASEMKKTERDLPVPVCAFMDDGVLHVLSKKMLNGVPLFVVRISEDLTFQNFHLGVRCTATTLSANKITTLQTWSAFEENIRFLNCVEVDKKKKVILEQLQAMGTQQVGKPLYTPEIIVRAFSYFATSRCLYERLQHDFQFPSVRTLTRITSKVARLDESTFSGAVFKSLEERQRLCVILQDEVYVKKMMLYHGGQVFGRGVDNPNCLAKTVLGIMVSCMFGGPNFLSRILPISKLNSTFLHEQVSLSRDTIEQAGGQVKAVICDGNRNNQALFRQLGANPQEPWQTEAGLFLLYDFVHLLKNIRNNWLTEPTGELTFEDDDGEKKTAKWQHLVELYKLESGSLVKLSDLDDVAVSPKPIERQKVSTCLKVFSEKTHQALLKHPEMANFTGVAATASFILKVLTWWKVVNVKSKGMDIRHKDDLQAAVSDQGDRRLDMLLRFGDMTRQMAGKQGKRQKQLTRDTAQAIYHTCNGLVSLCRHLLSTSHEYVLLGQFSTDPLEKEFSKLRQGSGGTYFINVQQITEKSNIDRAKLLLSLRSDKAVLDDVVPGHECPQCDYAVERDERACQTMDSIAELEASVPSETKSVLVYIAGYITRKDDDEDASCFDTTYFRDFGQYTQSLDRGGLKIPSDRACQWTILCFIIFNVVKASVCQHSFMKIAMTLSDEMNFQMEERHARIISNIFLRNFCCASTPRSTKEPALKRLKLSESS